MIIHCAREVPKPEKTSCFLIGLRLPAKLVESIMLGFRQHRVKIRNLVISEGSDILRR